MTQLPQRVAVDQAIAAELLAGAGLNETCRRLHVGKRRAARVLASLNAGADGGAVGAGETGLAVPADTGGDTGDPLEGESHLNLAHDVAVFISQAFRAQTAIARLCQDRGWLESLSAGEVAIVMDALNTRAMASLDRLVSSMPQAKG